MKQHSPGNRLALKLRRTHLGSILLLAVMIPLFVACNDTPTADLTPIEVEQIQSVIKDYYVRDASVPEQEVEIEEVADNWARVSMKPFGMETEPVFFFLQNHVDAVNDAPPAPLTVQPGNQARVATSTGWTIILGPQVRFSQEELDMAGIPEEIRQ